MKVQILGAGCARCKTLEERVRKIVLENQLNIEIEKVTDLSDILKFGILTTPGLVIDGKVKSSGAIPAQEKILFWLKGSPE